jgi:hypothetical protein
VQTGVSIILDWLYMSSVVDSIRPSLEKLFWTLNPRLVRDYRWYARARASSKQKATRTGVRLNGEPYWLLFPEWLAEMYRKKNNRWPAYRRFLKDVTWAQYCLFMAIKIHDDLFDRHVDRRALLWAGDEFLLEARRVFARHFEQSSRFWGFYHSAIRTTLRAIQDVDWLQNRRKVHFQKVFRLYAAMYEVCKIATFAVCLKAGRMRDFKKVSVFFDEMARVGQTIDDFEDIIEDSRRGRINVAGAYFLRFGDSLCKETSEKIAHNLIFTGASRQFFRMLRRHIQRAEKSIHYLKLTVLENFMVAYQNSVDGLSDHVHTQRVKYIFTEDIIRPEVRLHCQ